MSDWPIEVLGCGGYGPLSTAGEGSPVAEALSNAGSIFTAAAAWGTANTAVYVPIVIGVATTVHQLAWINGATVAGNVDVGIYARAGNRLVSSGSTAQSGVSVPQVVDIANTALAPAQYFLAMVADDATATYVRGGGSSSSPLCRASGMAMQASAFPLPATANFAGFALALACPLLMGSTENAVI